MAEHGELCDEVRRQYIKGESRQAIYTDSPLPRPEIDLVIDYFKGRYYNGQPGKHAPQISEEEKQFLKDKYEDGYTKKMIWREYCRKHRLIPYDRFEYLLGRETKYIHRNVKKLIEL